MACSDFAFAVPKSPNVIPIEAKLCSPEILTRIASHQEILDKLLQGQAWQQHAIQELTDKHCALHDFLGQEFATLVGKMDVAHADLHTAMDKHAQNTHKVIKDLVPASAHVGFGHAAGNEPGKEVIADTEDLSARSTTSENKPKSGVWNKYHQASMASLHSIPMTGKITSFMKGHGMDLLRKILMSHTFEMCTGAVILVDLCVLLVQSQWQYYGAGFDNGWKSDDRGWSSVKRLFEVTQTVLAAIYLVEFLLRVYVFRFGLFGSSSELLDMILIVVVSVNTFLLQPLGLDSVGGREIAVGRFLRIFKSFRVLRLIRFSKRFAELRVIVRTMARCANGLLWSSVIIGLILLVNALILTQVSYSIITDDSYSIDVRHWLYDKCGTVSRAWMVMFESTFSSAWIEYSRKFINEVNGFFAIYWIFFVVAVNFMCLRIIAALFLKQVMEIAAHDAEKQAMAKMRERERYAKYVEDIFRVGDTSGDGALSREEFDVMKTKPEIMSAFKGLELDIDEVEALFEMLCMDDGVADFYEFLHAASKMKSTARTLDAMQILHGQLKIQQTLDTILTASTGKTARHYHLPGILQGQHTNPSSPSANK